MFDDYQARTASALLLGLPEVPERTWNRWKEEAQVTGTGTERRPKTYSFADILAVVNSRRSAQIYLQETPQDQ